MKGAACFRAKASIFLVLLELGISVAGAKTMGELHRKRIDYAESDSPRWTKEFINTLGQRDPWPFTREIECLGRCLREFKTWLPIAGGAAFVIGLVTSN